MPTCCPPFHSRADESGSCADGMAARLRSATGLARGRGAVSREPPDDTPATARRYDGAATRERYPALLGTEERAMIDPGGGLFADHFSQVASDYSSYRP